MTRDGYTYCGGRAWRHEACGGYVQAECECCQPPRCKCQDQKREAFDYAAGSDLDLPGQKGEAVCPNHPTRPPASPSSNLCGPCLMGRKS